MKFLALTALIASVSAEDKCCVTCPSTGGYIKTYSIDPNAGHCGESCIKSFEFSLYHIFEKWLTKAANVDSHPCADHGYTQYWETETHGLPHVLTATVDLYNKPAAAAAKVSPVSILILNI